MRPAPDTGVTEALVAAVGRALESAGMSSLRIEGAWTQLPGAPASGVVILLMGTETPLRRTRVGHDGIVVDLDARIVDRHGVRLNLSPREWRLMALLAASSDRTVPTGEILAGLGGSREAFHATVHRLRRKVEPDPGRPSWILTVPGVGLRLRAGAP